MVMSWHLTEIAHSKLMVLSPAHSSVQFTHSVMADSLQPDVKFKDRKAEGYMEHRWGLEEGQASAKARLVSQGQCGGRGLTRGKASCL